MNLIVSEDRVKEILINDIAIHDEYIKYNAANNNIDILEDMSNLYTIDLNYFWLNEYEDNKLNIKLRPCIKEYEKEKAEFYVRKVDCGIQRVLYNNNDLILPAELTEVDIDTKIDESIVRYNAIARDINVSLYSYNNNDLETEWGDNTTDRLIKHHYENSTYNIKSSGLIDTETHVHTGKNITTIEKLRIDLIDGSWLFSECYYAEDSSFFPELNTANMDDMNHMFYNCPRITELDLSSYNTINVLDTSHMFDSCMNLKKLNLSNFNLVRTRNVDYMLMNCVNLTELRLDNCNETTIKKIIESEYFPTNKIEDESGMKRKIYCKRENTVGLKAPQNWMFAYNINNDENNMVKYESEKENLYIPEHMIEELNDNLYLFIDYMNHNEDGMNMDIS